MNLDDHLSRARVEKTARTKAMFEIIVSIVSTVSKSSHQNC